MQAWAGGAGEEAARVGEGHAGHRPQQGQHRLDRVCTRSTHRRRETPGEPTKLPLHPRTGLGSRQPGRVHVSCPATGATYPRSRGPCWGVHIWGRPVGHAACGRRGGGAGAPRGRSWATSTATGQSTLHQPQHQPEISDHQRGVVLWVCRGARGVLRIECSSEVYTRVKSWCLTCDGGLAARQLQHEQLPGLGIHQAQRHQAPQHPPALRTVLSDRITHCQNALGCMVLRGL